MSCSVRGCVNVKRFKPEGISFHWFPKGERLTEWLQILGMKEGWQWSKNKFVCSKHFNESDLIKLGHKVFLKGDAIPNLQPLLKDGGVSLNEVATKSAHQESKSAEQVATSTDDLSLLTTSTQPSSFSLIQTSSSDDTIICSGLRSKLTRRLEISSGEDSSRSTDDSTKRKRVPHLSKIRKKYIELKIVERKSRRKLYSAARTIRNLKRKITTLKTVVEDLKKKQYLSEGHS